MMVRNDENNRNAVSAQKLFDIKRLRDRTVRMDIILIDALTVKRPGFAVFCRNIKDQLCERNQKLTILGSSWDQLVREEQENGLDETTRKNVQLLLQSWSEGLVEAVLDDAPAGTPEMDAIVAYCTENRHAPDGRNQKIMVISADEKAIPQYLAINAQRSQKGGIVIVKTLDESGNLCRPGSLVCPREAEPDFGTQLPLDHVPTEGDAVWDAGRTASLRLGSRIGGGGDADIYEVEGQPELAAKIFHSGCNTYGRMRKLISMVAMHIEDERICAPGLVLYGDSAETTPGAGFCGYLMPRAEGFPLSESVFIPDQLAQDHPDWDKRHLIQLAKNILDVICNVHEMGMLVGDLSGNNILVGNSPEEIRFVDVDSWSVGRYSTSVTTEGFLAPELLCSGQPDLRTVEGENFSVAVLLFQLLVTPGRSPYDDGSDLTRNILEGRFQYPFKDHNGIEPPIPYIYCWSHIPYRLKELFYETLDSGGSRNAPEKRPSTAEWLRQCCWWKRQFDIGHVADPESFRILPTRHKIEYGKTAVTCAICGKKVDQDYCKQDEEGTWYCNECLKMTVEGVCECGRPIYYSFYNRCIEHKPAPTHCPACTARLQGLSGWEGM